MEGQRLDSEEPSRARGEALTLWSEAQFNRDEVIFDWRWDGKTADRVPPLVFARSEVGRSSEFQNSRRSGSTDGIVSGSAGREGF